MPLQPCAPAIGEMSTVPSAPYTDRVGLPCWAESVTIMNCPPCTFNTYFAMPFAGSCPGTWADVPPGGKEMRWAAAVCGAPDPGAVAPTVGLPPLACAVGVMAAVASTGAASLAAASLDAGAAVASPAGVSAPSSGA